MTTHSAECWKWHVECAGREVERLRALLDPDNEDAVAVVADAAREARASYVNATTPAELAATGVDGVSRHVARAVLAAMRKEADQ